MLNLEVVATAIALLMQFAPAPMMRSAADHLAVLVSLLRASIITAIRLFEISIYLRLIDFHEVEPMRRPMLQSNR